MSKQILVAYGVDIDAVGGWLGSYGGQDSPDDISRGLFAGEVGTPRIVELFRRYDMRQTFFWPGHSVETFPDQFDACVAAGHEIGVHGYSHENPIAMSRQQETDVLDYCVQLLTRRSTHTSGAYRRLPCVRPRGAFTDITKPSGRRWFQDAKVRSVGHR